MKTLTSFIDWRLHRFYGTLNSILAVVPLSIVVMRNVVKALTSFIGSGVLHRVYCTLNSVSAVVPLSIVVMRNVVKTLTSFISSGVLHRFYCTLTLFQLWCL